MRTHGTLSKWNDERGFGFIVPARGTDEVFVHVSAFPHDGTRPQIGELVSFEIEAGKDGRKRAVRVQRPGAARRQPTKAHAASRPRSARRTGFRGAAVALVALIALGTFGYQWLTQSSTGASAPTSEAHPLLASKPSLAIPAAESFQCDSRKYCSQMKSCAEATYFSKHCPGTKMDGDHDGIPCEQQWCQ